MKLKFNSKAIVIISLFFGNQSLAGPGAFCCGGGNGKQFRTTTAQERVVEMIIVDNDIDKGLLRTDFHRYNIALDKSQKLATWKIVVSRIIDSVTLPALLHSETPNFLIAEKSVLYIRDNSPTGYDSGREMGRILYNKIIELHESDEEVGKTAEQHKEIEEEVNAKITKIAAFSEKACYLKYWIIEAARDAAKEGLELKEERDAYIVNFGRLIATGSKSTSFRLPKLCCFTAQGSREIKNEKVLSSSVNVTQVAGRKVDTELVTQAPNGEILLEESHTAQVVGQSVVREFHREAPSITTATAPVAR